MSIVIMEEEKNKEYDHLVNHVSSRFLDAYLFVSSFIQYGMVLYNYHYQLVELAFQNNIGLHYTDLYNLESDDEKIQEERELYTLIELLLEYLIQENLMDDYDYLINLYEEGNIFI